MPDPAPHNPDGLSRREFVASTVAAGAALAAGELTHAEPTSAPAGSGDAVARAEPIELSLNVNGATRTARVDPRATLLDALRDGLGLTGAKKGCDHGQCGSCTVLMDGRRVNACLVFARAAVGAAIATVEGLAHGDVLHPVQAAFLEHDALQCGFCTPGQICSAVGLVHEGHATSDADIREQMSGNLCRCGAYANIVAAVHDVLPGNAQLG
ncbi:MAG: (2Fe-2S)-binding protein [Phycisphaerae bacterium]